MIILLHMFLTIEDLIELSRWGMSHKVGRYADLWRQSKKLLNNSIPVIIVLSFKCPCFVALKYIFTIVMSDNEIEKVNKSDNNNKNNKMIRCVIKLITKWSKAFWSQLTDYRLVGFEL